MYACVYLDLVQVLIHKELHTFSKIVDRRRRQIEKKEINEKRTKTGESIESIRKEVYV